MSRLTPELIGALQAHGGPWEIPMIDTPFKVPDKWFYGCCCACCSVYSHRRELLELTHEKYLCCAGLFPCGPLAEPQDEVCLYAEVCCCFGLALSANRWMLQTRFLKQNDPCDDALILCNALLGCFECMLRTFTRVDEDVLDTVKCISDTMNCCVVSCMNAQHQQEIENIKGTNVKAHMDTIMQYLPPKQQEMAGIRKV